MVAVLAQLVAASVQLVVVVVAVLQVLEVLRCCCCGCWGFVVLGRPSPVKIGQFELGVV